MKLHKYHIRKYQSEDLDTLAKIYADSIRHLGPTAYSESQIEAWSSFAKHAEFANWIELATTFVAVAQNGVIIGFAGFSKSGYVSAVFVTPLYQRIGVGSSLLTKVLSAMKSLGFKQVASHASEFSRPLFEKFGFTVSEIEHTEVNGIGISRYAMQTHI